MVHINRKDIELCWPVGAPLKDCHAGLVDEVFLQPRDQIEEWIKGRDANGKHSVWPYLDKDGKEVPNPTGKKVYWSMQDPFTVADLS